MNSSELKAYERCLLRTLADDILLDLYIGVIQPCGFSIRKIKLCFDAWVLVKNEIERRRHEREVQYLYN